MANERAGTSFKNGSRWYEFEDGVKHPGVTSILNQLPKPFLGPWQARMAAEWAVQHVAVVTDLAARDPKAATELIKGAAKRSTAGSADLGSAVHEYAESKLLGNTTAVPISDDESRMRASFDQFLVDWRPEVILTEFTVRDDRVGYAGSGDAVLNVGGVNVIVDYKTGRSLHSEVGLQLAAYRYAETLAAGAPLPLIEGAAVLHLTTTGYSFHPVKAGPEQFEVFQHLRAIFDWTNGGERGVIGKALTVPG